MDKDKIFIEQHKRAQGEESAKKMLEIVKKSQIEPKNASNVYINVYGEEVHVNGPIVQPVSKYETLAEKIARFDRLAENVRANRALLLELSQLGAFDDSEPESDEEAEKAMEKVVSVDEFGDVHVVSQPKMSFAEPKESAESATDDVGNDSSIADDESAQESSAKPSDMVEQ